MTPAEMGKLLFIIGIVIALLGLVFMLAGKFNISWLGHLPGDFSFRGKNFSFYFPLTTSLLVSIVLSVIIWIISRK
ncbi:MAG: DUF2905 domain-containing protein [Deltaproteobacteria bacterium]|jgi:hypothetical protein|nr:DUF2905 domain-containing protein [Deltaproteobacteria bacterium]